MIRPARLLLVAVVAFAGAAGAQDAWWRGLNGRYVGPAESGGKSATVTTNLRTEPGGGVLGTFAFAEPGNVSYSGTIDSCIVSGQLTLRCRWVDRYGNGPVELTFRPDLSSFSGKWTGTPETSWRRWDGARAGPAGN